MKCHLVYRKNGRHDPVLSDIEPNIESIDQGATDRTPQPIEVFLEVPPLTETTNLAERENQSTFFTHTAKKFRPFSTELYNEILHKNIPKTPDTPCHQSEKETDCFSGFKLPISDQYDPEGKKNHWWHVEQRTNPKLRQITSKTEIVDQKTINKTENKTYLEAASLIAYINENKSLEKKLNDAKEDLKLTARKIVKEKLEKAVSLAEEMEKEINVELNIENEIRKMIGKDVILTSKIIEFQQENPPKEELFIETSDISKSSRDTVQMYESIQTKPEIVKESKPEDERKLFLMQEIKESIEQGSVSRSRKLFENKTKSKQCYVIKDRQIEKLAKRKAYSIGSETITHIKRTAESTLSNPLLKIFFFYFAKVMIALTQYIPLHTSKLYDISRKERQEITTKLIVDDQESIRTRKFSAADIAQLVSRKPKDLTQRMNTVISEFHSKLHINNSHDKANDNRRAKSCSRFEYVTKSNNNFEWLDEMDSEEREQVKKEIKLATLVAARRVLGRRRSYHNISDLENGKVDGLTYIAIVESHVYTNKNAIFDDYISELKSQIHDTLDITDIKDMKTVADECLANKTYEFSKNQIDFRNVCIENMEEAFRSDDLCIDEVTGQKIDYVATVTVEHKQIPTTISIQNNKGRKDNENENLDMISNACTSDVEEIKCIAQELVPPIDEEDIKEIIKEPTSVTETNVKVNEKAVKREMTTDLSNEIKDGTLIVSELKGELPTIIMEKENTQVYAHKVPTVLHQVDIDSKISAKSATEVCKLESTLTTKLGISREIITESDTAVITEGDKIEEQLAIPKIETKELVNAQAVAVATTRHTTEVFDEVKKDLTFTEITKELPTITLEEENLKKPVIFGNDVLRQVSEVFNVLDEEVEGHSLQEDTANQVIEIKEFSTALQLTYAHIEEINTRFDQLNIDSLDISENNEEFAISCIEIHELNRAHPICTATASQINVKLEQSEYFETKLTGDLEQCESLEVVEEVMILYSVCYGTMQDVTSNTEGLDVLSIKKTEEESVTSSQEPQDFHTVNAYCISTASHFTIDLYEVDNFDVQSIKEEEAEQSVEVDIFSQAQSLCTEICQETKTSDEEVQLISIDMPTNEFASAKEEDNICVTVLSIATPYFTQLNITYTEVDVIENECILKEHATCDEEKREFYLSQSVCVPICHSIKIHFEDHDLLEIDEKLEELASISIETQAFERALSVCISTSSETSTIYVETETLIEESLHEEKAESSVEKNNYFTALKKCNEISQDIELLLEESQELIIEKTEEEFTSVYAEPFVLEKALPLSTPMLSQIYQELYETLNFEIESMEKSEANLLVEVSKLTLILSMCIATVEVIFKDLEECTLFKVDEIKEESGYLTEQPHVLFKILPRGVSILEDINVSYESTEVIENNDIPKKKADSTLEVTNLVTILCICTGVTQTVITTLDEVNLFHVDKISEYQAFKDLEPQVFCKILAVCMATLFMVNIPTLEVTVRESEIFEHKTASWSLEMKDYVTAQAICQATFNQVDMYFMEVESTSKSYDIKEEYAKLTYEDVQLDTINTVNSATVKQANFYYDIAENYNISHLEQDQITGCVTESRDFTIAHSIRNATAKNENVKLHSVEDYVANIERKSAVIKIEPKRVSDIVSVHEINVSYGDNSNLINKSRKNKSSETVSLIEDEKLDLTQIKEATLQENFTNFESINIKESKDNFITNGKGTILEEPVYLKTKGIVSKSMGRNKSDFHKASNAVYQETNVKSNKINVQKAFETTKNETNVQSIMIEAEPIIKNLNESNVSTNVNIINKADVQKNEACQEMSYNLTVTKSQVRDESVTETKEDTDCIKRSKDLKQCLSEEFQEEINVSLDKDVEEESGLIIQEIIDLDENNEDCIDIEKENESKDFSLVLNLQSQIQDATEDFYETSTFVKRNRNNKEQNSNQDKSAALTIFKRENIAVEESKDIESYKEDNTNVKNTTYSKINNEYVGNAGIVSSHSSDFEIKSTAHEGIINKKRVSKRLSQSNTKSHSAGLKKDTHQEIIGNGSAELEINISKSQLSNTIEDTIFEKLNKKSFITQETSTFASSAQEFDSTAANNKSRLLSIKTNLKREEAEGSQISKNDESPLEIESPTKPPTPLTDEYIFRLVAPLPKSRSTTPIPREPNPAIIEDNEDRNIGKKNLVPTIESVTIERVVFNPPLPTPPTSPVHSPTYTRPGLNGGMKRLPRYFKPGLRGGSDRSPVPKEEILELRKNLSTLTSDINETFKNIEKYKKLVEILKHQKVEGEGSSKMMEENETADKLPQIEVTVNAQDVKENERSEQNNIITEKSIDEQHAESINNQQNYQNQNFVDIKFKEDNNIDTITIEIKHEPSKKTEEERIKGYNIKEVTSFEEIEKEHENTGIVELAPDTAGVDSVEKEYNTINAEDFTTGKPETDSVLIKEEIREKEVKKSEDKVGEISDEEQEAADEEVSKVTELTIDSEISTTKETSPIMTTPREVDMIKEAHLISLTRVLSSHMLREGLSPDCQKMKDKFEHRQNTLEDDKQINKEDENDRSWTTFLQKSTHLPSNRTLGHIADLQNKFENPFIAKLTDRSELRISPAIKPRDFNSSPVPWQERALSDSLGAPNTQKTDALELTPGEQPEYFLAIPTESKDDGDLKSTVIPLPYPVEHRIPNIEISKGETKEERKTENAVEEIIQEAVRVVESLEIGVERNKLIQLLLNNIKKITNSSIPVEDQLSQMRSHLETLEQVPDVIRQILENVEEKLRLLNQKKETLHSKGAIKSLKEESETKANIAVEVAIKKKPQIVKEDTNKVAVMPAETKGELLVKDKKQCFGPQTQEPQKVQMNKPQPMFGWMNPEPRPLKLPGGKRWRRTGEEYSEEQIAETILAHSELIQGKTMGINFMKYEKPPIPLDHLQHSEVYKLIHNVEQAPPKRVEFLRTAIAEADYRERCRSLSPCPSESSKEQKSSFVLHKLQQ